MFTQPTPYTEAPAVQGFTVPQPPVHAPAAPAPVRFEHPPTGEQQAILDAAATGQPLVVEAGAGTGKALRDDQPVLTPSGWKPIGSLQVGDQVIGSAGTPVRVTGVYPQGVRPLWEVITSDGVGIIADAFHLWTTQTTQDRQKGRDRWEVRTTSQIAATLTVRHGDRDRFNHYLPMLSAPVDGPDVACPLDPWLVGVLIGDGQLSGSIGLSNPDPGVLARVRTVLPDGVELAPQSAAAPNGKDWRITGHGATKPGHRGMWNPVTAALRDLGLHGKLSHEKTIPDQLLHASARQRHQLLAGLMDSDGYAAGHEAEFSTTSPVLAEQVVSLVQSLGGTARVSHRPSPTYAYKGEQRTGRPAWRVQMSMPADVLPFAYSAKAARYTPRSKYPPRRQIVAVLAVADGPATCISVDAPDQLYVTKGCVLTHNTSTLKMVAAATPRRALYLAYNKAIADEALASFSANTDCRTAHSLAFRAVGHQYKDRLNGPRLPAREVARLLRIPAVVDLGKHALTSVKVARLVMDAVKRFCYSDFDEPSRWHIPQVPGLEEVAVHAELCDQLVPLLYRAWEDLTAPGGRLKFEHDHYLKLWALTNPTLPADLVFLDEAQDANPVISRIVEAQAAQRILVGDQSQAIYGWRGAVDAMQEFEGERFQLSQSFRFGQAIADEANRWLDLLDAPLRLTGNPAKESKVGVVYPGRAILCRTNAGAIGQAMAALGAGLRPALVGGGDDIRRLARACQDLRNGRSTDHPELMAFASWAEVQEYAEHDAGGQDLKTLVKLVDGHGPEAILRVVDQLVDESNADIVISTAHRAKGREWDTVRLAADFREPYNQAGQLDRPEAMLTYVAVTRAKDLLDKRALDAAAAGGIGHRVLAEQEELDAEQAALFHSPAGSAAAVHRIVFGSLQGVGAREGSAPMDITVTPAPSHDVLTPDPPRIDTDLPPELVGWLDYAKQAADNEKSWKEVKEVAQQKIKDWCVANNIDQPTVAGQPACSYKENAPGGQLDGKQLKADHPDIYAAYYKPKKASRPFNFLGRWK